MEFYSPAVHCHFRWFHDVDTEPAGPCPAGEGHQHEYDHLTQCLIGRIQVFQFSAAKADGERTIIRSDILGPGDPIDVPANVFHLVKPLTPDYKYQCVSHERTFTAQPVKRLVKTLRAAAAEGKSATFAHGDELNGLIETLHRLVQETSIADGFQGHPQASR